MALKCTHHITIWCPRHYIPFDCYVSSWIQWIICRWNDKHRSADKKYAKGRG